MLVRLLLILIFISSLFETSLCMFCTKPRLVGGCVKCTPETENEVCNGQKCKDFVRECLGGNAYVHKFWHKHDHIHYHCKNAGDIALTFDDAPQSEETLGRIKKKLEELKVPATFFVSGNLVNATSGKLLAELESLGHTLAVHGFKHQSVLERNSNEEYFNQEFVPTVQEANKYLKNGLKRYFRPPFLDLDKSFASFIAEKKGYKTIQINFETDDWKHDDLVRTRVDEVFDNEDVTADDHSFIILEHDLLGKTDTDQDIEYIVKRGREKGFRFVNMEECVGPELEGNFVEETQNPEQKAVGNIKIEDFWGTNDNIVYKCKVPGHVAITVDGLPKNFNTLLEYLFKADEYEIPLTFFVEGELLSRAEAFAEEKGKLLNCAQKLGHTIASNTYSREDVDHEDGFKTFMENEIQRNEQVIHNYLDKGLKKYLRPVYLGVDPWFADAMGNEGYKIVLANVNSHDFGNQGRPARIARKVVRPFNRGSPEIHSFIVLLHELEDSVAALPEIVRVGRADGYKFVDMEECVTGVEKKSKKKENSKDEGDFCLDDFDRKGTKEEEEDKEQRKEFAPKERFENVRIFEHWQENDNIHYKCKNPGDVALTFDDVPADFEILFDLLEQLQVHNILATFFVNGGLLVKKDTERKGKLLRCAEKLGHTIGAHTFSHANIHKKAHDEEFLLREIVDNEKIVNKHLVHGMKKYFRPPFLKPDEAFADKIAKKFGYLTIQVNFDSADWRHPEDTARIVKHLRRPMVRGNPKENSFILLQHELIGNIEAIGRLADIAKETGYRFVEMDECITGIKPPERSNNENCLQEFNEPENLSTAGEITEKSNVKTEITPTKITSVQFVQDLIEESKTSSPSSINTIVVLFFLCGIVVFVIKVAPRFRFTTKKTA